MSFKNWETLTAFVDSKKEKISLQKTIDYGKINTVSLENW